MGYIKINSAAFAHNIEIIAKKAGGTDKIIAVLKDNAYGHGLKEVSQLAKKAKIKRVAVKDFSEADRIRDDFESILVLRELPLSSVPYLITINSIDSLNSLPSGSNICIKVDTGMHRNGIVPEDLQRAFEISSRQGHKIDSVFTHFKSSDELSSELFWQMKKFEEIKHKSRELAKKFAQRVSFHSANSSAIFRLKNIEDDFVRPGIAMYGYLESDLVFKAQELLPVMSLWAQKISSRKLIRGQRVGYGGIYEAKTDMVVSNYDIGYGDGFFRTDGKRDLLSADGKEILGRISMDNFSCEGEDEEVCLFDNAKKISSFFGTISYEILAKLSPSIPKIVF